MINNLVKVGMYLRQDRIYSYEEFSKWVEYCHFERKKIREELKTDSEEDLPSHFDFEGDLIKYNNKKYKMLYQNNVCVGCGLKGTHFYKEKCEDTDIFHINVYGYKNGREIQLTKDHIRPRSKGGSNSLVNLQTMCAECNNLKGSTFNKKFMKDRKRSISVDLRPWPPEKTVQKHNIPEPKMPILYKKVKSEIEVVEKLLTVEEKRGKVLCIDCKYFSRNESKCNYEFVEEFDYVIGVKYVRCLECYVSNKEGLCKHFKCY